MDKKEGKRKGNQNRGVYDYYAQYRQQVQQQYEQQQYEQQQYEQQVMAYGYQPHQQMHPDWNQMYAAQQAAHQMHHPYESYGYQYPVQQMEGVPLPLPPGIPGLGGSTDPLEAVLGPFPCARLKNLPYDVSLEDILLLFQGLVVIDVILVANGEAYLIFANPMDFQMALQRDRQPIGRQFVEISAASRDQYYAAIAKQHLQEQEGSRHIASSVGSSSIGRNEEVRGEEQQESATAALWTGASGSPNPSVLQSFGGASPYSTGSLGTHQQHLGPSQQEHGSSSSVMSGRGTSESSRPAIPPLQKRTGGGIQVGDHTGFLRMRGLPFSSAKEDIYHFFESYNPVQESIVLTYRNDGRATGEAYIGFETPEDAKRAMELHRRMMGNRYIELFISNKEEQGRALARFGGR